MPSDIDQFRKATGLTAENLAFEGPRLIQRVWVMMMNHIVLPAHESVVSPDGYNAMLRRLVQEQELLIDTTDRQHSMRPIRLQEINALLSEAVSLYVEARDYHLTSAEIIAKLRSST